MASLSSFQNPWISRGIQELFPGKKTEIIGDFFEDSASSNSECRLRVAKIYRRDRLHIPRSPARPWIYFDRSQANLKMARHSSSLARANAPTFRAMESTHPNGAPHLD